MKLSELIGRTPQLPLSLALDNGQTLVVEQWLRVLPEQRYVAKAQWQGRTVLAKLVIGSKASRQLLQLTERKLLIKFENIVVEK